MIGILEDIGITCDTSLIDPTTLTADNTVITADQTDITADTSSE